MIKGKDKTSLVSCISWVGSDIDMGKMDSCFTLEGKVGEVVGDIFWINNLLLACAYLLRSCLMPLMTLLSRFIHFLHHLLSHYGGGTQILLLISILILDGT